MRGRGNRLHGDQRPSRNDTRRVTRSGSSLPCLCLPPALYKSTVFVTSQGEGRFDSALLVKFCTHRDYPNPSPRSFPEKLTALTREHTWDRSKGRHRQLGACTRFKGQLGLLLSDNRRRVVNLLNL